MDTASTSGLGAAPSGEHTSSHMARSLSVLITLVSKFTERINEGKGTEEVLTALLDDLAGLRYAESLVLTLRRHKAARVELLAEKRGSVGIAWADLEGHEEIVRAHAGEIVPWHASSRLSGKQESCLSFSLSAKHHLPGPD